MITIITPSYNQQRYIERTIRSVLDQAADDGVEYIVMDGGSTDGTLDILKRYEGRIRWFSARDNGQSDAINQGLALSGGEIIGWLNSDDCYLPGTLQKVKDFFQKHPEKKWVYGRCRIIDENDREIRRMVTFYKNLISSKFSYKWLLMENYISQPAVFFRKEVLAELGHTNPDLHYTMDYEMWLRMGAIYPAGVIHSYLASFRRHAGTKSEMDFRKQFREGYEVVKKMDKGWFVCFIHKLNTVKIIGLYRAMKFFGS